MGAVHDKPAIGLYEAISNANTNSKTFLVTVIRGGHLGEKALVTDGELGWCSADDGFLKAHEAEVISAHESEIRKIGGEEVYIELLGNEKHVVICGAGHVAMPVIAICRMMGMEVTVIDDREEFAENAWGRGANRVICKPFAEALKEVDGNEDTFFVVVTRGHRYDKDCVGGALRKKHAYVGMIGSRRHSAFVKQTLLKEGLSEELIDSIYTPIGLDIGAETPEEIAVAIVGEIIEVKNRKKRNFGFPREIMKAILSDDREPMMLATIVARSGSAPRAVGSRMLVRKDGTIVGTIGGGAAEGEIMRYCAELLRGSGDGSVTGTGDASAAGTGDKSAAETGDASDAGTGDRPVSGAVGNGSGAYTELRHVDLSCSAEEDGMVCGGVIDVLLELV